MGLMSLTVHVQHIACHSHSAHRKLLEAPPQSPLKLRKGHATSNFWSFTSTFLAPNRLFCNLRQSTRICMRTQN